MTGFVQNELGKVIYTPEIFAEIAGHATLDNYGIVGMTAKSARDGLWELVGRDNLRKGVQVTIEDNAVVLDLFVMMQYGVSINAVAENVIHNVGYKLNELTGITVAAVNVHVEGVRVL